MALLDFENLRQTAEAQGGRAEELLERWAEA
jgi:hypothetical protein